MAPDEDKKLASEDADTQDETRIRKKEKPAESAEPADPAIPIDTKATADAVKDVLKDEESTEAATNRYLAENLPETEDRIKTSMDQNCKVSVVIPAYGERDYILQPLESLSKQEGTATDQYEVIIVENTPANPPTPSEDESPTFSAKRLAQYNKAVLENQKTIDLIRYINGENIGLDLTPAERKKADSIKSSGLKLFYVDKASTGKTLPENEANVGGARNRGIAEAIERFHTVGRNGIIAQTDADTRCDTRYIQGLIQVFEERPGLVGLAGSVRLDDSGFNDKLLKLSSLYTRLNIRYDFALKLFKKEKATKETAAKGIGFCGANMASRAFETAVIGGIPKTADREDFEFGQRLSKVGEIATDNRVVTMPIDRLSARTGKHGHGYRKLSVADSISERGSIYIQDPEGTEEIPLEEASSRLIKMFCKDEQVRSKYENFRAELINRENKSFNDRMQVVERLLDVIFEKGKEDFDADSLVQTIKTLGIDTAEDELLGDLSKGFAASNKFVETVADSKTKQDAIRGLKDIFTEDLNPVEENPILLRSLELKAIHRAVQ